MLTSEMLYLSGYYDDLTDLPLSLHSRLRFCQVCPNFHFTRVVAELSLFVMRWQTETIAAVRIHRISKARKRKRGRNFS